VFSFCHLSCEHIFRFAPDALRVTTFPFVFSIPEPFICFSSKPLAFPFDFIIILTYVALAFSDSIPNTIFFAIISCVTTPASQLVSSSTIAPSGLSTASASINSTASARYISISLLLLLYLLPQKQQNLS
jgi:hypothetical protein